MTLANMIGATPRLLIVDHEPAICYTLQHILEHYGYAARAISDGAVALALLRHEPFDLVLIEPQLPGRIDGRKLIQLAAVHQPKAVIMLLTEALELALPHDRVSARRHLALDKTASPATIANSVVFALEQRTQPTNRYRLVI
jgi:DNA-binding response OmpR family regulator